MNHIYHEKQDGALCGQHCINNLLQDDYFTAVELAAIADQMDLEETNRMAESGTDTSDFQQFLAQPSSNMDDSGMFSIQVLTKALETFSLSLVNFASSQPLALSAQENPIDQAAYICNFREHWFTIRKLGFQWFNLNSLLSYPELISDTYLSLFLKQLQHDGYSIFLVDGKLPTTKADEELRLQPAVQTVKPKLLSQVASFAKRSEEQELQAALTASLAKADVIIQGCSEQGTLKQKGYTLRQSQSEKELQAALQMSMQSDPTYAEEINSDDDDEYKQAIKLSLEASGSSEDSVSKKMVKTSNIVKEDKELEDALQMSLDTSLLAVDVPENLMEPDLDEIRQRRIEKLDKKYMQ